MRVRLVLVFGVLALGSGCSGGSDAGGGATTTASSPPTTVPGQVPPPILPDDQRDAVAARAPFKVPEGFFDLEEVAKKPLSQPEVHWVRNDGADLPVMLSPCGGPLPSDADRVGGRQLVLVSPTLWKAGRIVVYRDVAAATRAMTELRAALGSCAEHLAGGVTVRWQTRPLTTRDESLFVAAQRFMGADAFDGNYRGSVTRVGRAVLTYLDFGGRSHAMSPSEIDSYVSGDHTMADKLATADWAR